MKIDFKITQNASLQNEIRVVTYICMSRKYEMFMKTVQETPERFDEELRSVKGTTRVRLKQIAVHCLRGFGNNGYKWSVKRQTYQT